jgi:hypothetical protein
MNSLTFPSTNAIKIHIPLKTHAAGRKISQRGNVMENIVTDKVKLINS